MSSKPILLIGAIAAAIATTWALATKAGGWIRRLVHLIDDLVGETARPGVPARPGIKEEIAEIRALVEATVHNTQPNGGDSPHDALIREQQATRADVQALRDDLHETQRTLTLAVRQAAAHRRESNAWRTELAKRADEHGFTVPEWPTLSPPDDEETT